MYVCIYMYVYYLRERGRLKYDVRVTFYSTAYFMLKLVAQARGICLSVDALGIMIYILMLLCM